MENNCKPFQNCNNMSTHTILYNFIEFEKQQQKVKRGNKLMYDIKGKHRYLTLSELFKHYIVKYN